MKIIVLLLLVLLALILRSAEIIGVTIPDIEEVNLGSEIELIEYKTNIYTQEVDTLISYLLILDDTLGLTNYFHYKLNSDIQYQYNVDSTLAFYLQKNEFSTYPSRVFTRLNSVTPLLCLLENRTDFFEKNDEIQKTSSVIEGETKIFQILQKPKKKIIEYQEIVYKWNIEKKQQIEYTYTPYLNGEEFELTKLQLIFRRCQNKEIINEIKKIIASTKSFTIKENKKNTPSEANTLSIGDTLSYTNLLDSTNATISIETLFKGSENLLMYNWGIWCGYCLKNKSFVEEFYHIINSKIPMITINCEFNRATINDLELYRTRHKLTYPVYYGCGFLNENNIIVYPSMILIDKNLIVRDVLYQNVLDVNEYIDFVSKYLVEE